MSIETLGPSEEQQNQILDCIDRIGSCAFCFIVPLGTGTQYRYEWIWTEIKKLSWGGVTQTDYERISFQETFFCFLLAMNQTGDFNP